MEQFTLWANYLGEREKEEIAEHLDNGEAVRVDSACIGHTRAKMVEYQALAFFEEVGASPVLRDELGRVWFAL